jgi:hypothetical protein
MARWMRFMAVVGICGALVMLLVVMVAIGAYSSLHGIGAMASDPRLAKIQAFVDSNRPLPYILTCAFLAAAAVALWQNMFLYHAGDDFHLVATTDTADLDYLARGLDRLRSFFKIQVLVVAIAVGLTIVTGIVAAAMLRTH